MNPLQLSSTAIFLALVIAAVFGMAKGLAFLCFYWGIQACIRAKEYYMHQQTKLGIACFLVGVGSCVCAFFSITNII